MSDAEIQTDAAVRAAARVLLDAVLSVLDQDGHTHGSRKCETCQFVSNLWGRPFGCVRVAKERT